MRALVLAHVDQFRRFLNSAKRRFNGGFRTADKSDNRTIRGRARIDIEQRNALSRLNGVGDLSNHILIAPFRKVRYTLD